MEAIVDKISHLLKPSNVQIPIPDFVGIVSNIYHNYEASFYDSSQESLNDSVKSWQMALNAIETKTGTSLRLLDYGCGTGFATLQVLQSPLGSFIREVVCYDLSPTMMAICREKMKKFPLVSFLFLSDKSDLSQLSKLKPFDLVITNALLHHLLDVEDFMHQIRDWVAPSGYYIAGHEPNHNFYINKELVKTTKSFQKYKRFRYRLSLKYWLQKIRLKMRLPDLALLTNQELLRSKLISAPIPRGYLHKLVDIHVPFGITLNQPWGEIGFKGHKLKEWLGDDFELMHLYTYSHIKDSQASNDLFWSKQIKQLQVKYPHDGADCLVAFKRKP